jgi:hypothetical protein
MELYDVMGEYLETAPRRSRRNDIERTGNKLKSERISIFRIDRSILW